MNKQSFYAYQSTLKVEELIMYTSPQHLWTSNSPRALFKWPQIWHKGACTITCEMMFAPCPANLVCNFQKKSCKNSNLGFNLWSIYQNEFVSIYRKHSQFELQLCVRLPRKSEKIIQGTKVVIIHRSTYSFETFNF